jgi:F-type H+-transporting ATPase subunit delta
LSNETVGRNYAEALFEMGERSGNVDLYAELIDGVAAAVETTPRVPKSEKARILGDAMQGAPREFGLFLQALVRRNRHRILRDIAREYLGLLDVKLHRVRAGVTLARTPDEKQKRAIQEMLSRQLNKQVIAGFSVDPEILGGAIVRVGDRVLDGSVRRRMTKLRRQLLAR